MSNVPSKARAPHDDEVAAQAVVPLLLEPSSSLPLVDIQITVRTGTVQDPSGLEGLSWAFLRMLRMGTSKLQQAEVEEKVAGFGAQLAMEVSTSYLRLSASVLRRNLDEVFELLVHLLLEPAFREADLAQTKREGLASLKSRRDNDRMLAALHFRSILFGDHPYGRTLTSDSIARITVDDLRRYHQSYITRDNLIVGFAGDIDRKSAEKLVNKHLQHAAVSREKVRDVPPVTEPSKRHLRLVDKPQRTQVQIMVGCVGVRYADSDYLPLLVGNTVFGGTFTGRVMQEVRANRGWSYGAASQLSADRERDAWWLSTFPGSENAAACVELVLQLFHQWADHGVTEDEFDFAKRYLVRSHPFSRDTAVKRLGQQTEELLYALPRGFYRIFSMRLQRVGFDDVNQALCARFSAAVPVAAVVATAKDIEKALRSLQSFECFSVAAFDSL